MYQKITIIGNVGQDAEMRYTPSGHGVASFSVAANRQYKNQTGETVKETAWFRVSTWGKLAETCKLYVKKGMLILVDGRLNADPATGGPRTYQKSDGSSAASFEITAETVKFLSSDKSNKANQEEPAF